MTMASTRKTMVGFGFMDDEEFDKALREVRAERQAKAK